MKTKLSDKNRLVRKYMEHENWKKFQSALGRKKRGRGIYALYKGEKLYYIGLSKSSLRHRLRQHATIDRHKGKWDNFSFYQIGKTKYIKDIESLLLRIAHAPGNMVGGRFHKKYNLKKNSNK